MPAVTTLLTVAAVAGVGAAGYSAYQSYEQGQEQKHALEEQARIDQAAANKQADLERKAGASEAAQIREKGKRLLAAQRAQLASAGVKVDAGTGDVLQDETKRLTEQDALAAIKDAGTRYRLLRENGANSARMLNRQAKNAGKAGMAGLISGGLNALSIGASAGADISKASKVKTTTPSVATRTGQKYSLLNGPYSLQG